MGTATHMRTPTPEPVSSSEGFALLDEQARERLGLSGTDFLAQWDAGVYAGPEGDQPEVVKVAMLIPLAR